MFVERILVTGGAGFIGSHLVEALLAKGYKVRVLDNLSSGKVSNLPMDNANLNLVVGDVADSAAVSQAMRDCSAVVHLAAVASVQASVDDPVSTHQSNFVGTLNVCENMLKAGIKRVVFASSAAIYGNNGEGSAIDENTAKSPLTPYASDKLASEHYGFLSPRTRPGTGDPEILQHLWPAPGSVFAVLRCDQHFHRAGDEPAAGFDFR
jgi:UDP-glucose 4-epimerase